MKPLATSGTIWGSCQNSSYVYASAYATWIYWERNSVSVTNNTSNISVYVGVKRTDGYSASAVNLDKKPYVSLKVGGVERTPFVDYIDTRNGVSWTFVIWTGDVAHASDGTLALPLSCSWTLTGTSSLGAGYISGTATLDTIPRASSVSATNANIGSATTITISRASTSFTHTLAYSFAGLTGTIATKTTETSISWTVPTSFYAKIPNATSGKCTITCDTYNGTTKIGTNSCVFDATASKETCSPSVRVSSTDVNTKSTALTGNNKSIISGISNLRVVTTATANNGASITSISAYCGSTKLDGSDVTFAGADSAAVYVVVKDSRGYETRVDDKTLTLINYVDPTIVPTITRDTPTGDTVTVVVKGSWFSGSFGTKHNSLWVQVAYKLDGTGSYGTYYTLAMSTSGNTYTATINLSGIDYTKAYRFQVRLYDEVYADGSKQASDIHLSKGVPVFDWGENDFKFNVPVEFFEQSLFKTQTVHFNGDANDVTYNALFRTTTGATNCPSNNGFLIALAPVPGHVVFQIGCDFKGASLKHRTYWYGTWNDWQTFS